MPMNLSPEMSLENMMEEYVAAKHKIEVSKRIIAKGFNADLGMGDIVYKWVIEALEKNVPILERRVIQLSGYIATERDRRK